MVVQSFHCVDNTDPGCQVESEKKSPAGRVGAAVSSKRRMSARLKATRQKAEKEESERRLKADRQRAEKEALARKRAELLDENEGSSKKRAIVHSRKANVDNVNDDLVVEDNVSEDGLVVQEKVCEVLGSSEEKTAQNGVTGVAAVTEKSVFARVRETLRLFNKHYLHFVQEEEKRCQNEQIDKKASKNLKTKKGNAIGVDEKKRSKCPDLKALSKMIESNAVMYHENRIGNLPGINVGHSFYSRAEMVTIGIHRHWLNEIDYMGMSYSKEHKNYEFSQVVAIVMLGMYGDDLDNAEDVVYTVQGGHDLCGNKHQICDQVMERGNLALKNCVEQSVPIRVVRGLECSSSYSSKLYTYDGLYKELTYDYGYALDSVHGSDGKIKQMVCHCGAADCRKRLF